MVRPVESTQRSRGDRLEVVDVGAEAVLAVHASLDPGRHLFEQSVHVPLGSGGHIPRITGNGEGPAVFAHPVRPLAEQILGLNGCGDSLERDQ